MSKNFVFVYEWNEYAEMGGGTYVEFFNTQELMDEFANQILVKKDHKLVFAGQIHREISYKAKEFVTKFIAS